MNLRTLLGTALLSATLVPVASAGSLRITIGTADPYAQSFRRADRNHDGRVSRWEAGLGAPTFARLDRNRNGWLDVREYGRHRAPVRYPTFRAVDRNHDGWVAGREFPASRRTFRRADRDRNGLLDHREYHAVRTDARYQRYW